MLELDVETPLVDTNTDEYVVMRSNSE